MQILHKGFDTITLAIKANIPHDLFDFLVAEKELAEAERAPRPISYGGADFDLQPHGGSGYAFLLTGGPMDVRWAFKKPNSKDPWGTRVTVGSTLLATQGLGFVRAHLDKTLTRLGIRYLAEHISLSRVDFCVDVLAPDFDLTPENFVLHSHSNRADHITPDAEMRSNGKSGRFTSVTAGKMPGRQVIIYDKRREVIDRRKLIWWDIWNASRDALGEAPLDPKDRDASQVWRIELRAGKNLLKDRWNIRTWADFDKKFGDLIAETFEKVRYAEPDPSDTNRARWPNHAIWDLVSAVAEDDLQEMRSYLDVDKVKSVHKADHIKLIMTLMIGNATTLAAMEGTTEEDLTDYMIKLGKRLKDDIHTNPSRAANKLSEAKARYRFVA